MIPGKQNEVGKLGTVLLKRPTDSFLSDETISDQWEALNYTSKPDFGRAVEEYSEFESILRSHADDLMFLPHDDSVGLDSIYVRDTSIITSGGLVLCNMGKDARDGEPKLVKRFADQNEIPILGEITGDGRIEGGDLFWLDEQTLLVGSGYRTNHEGIRQLRELAHDVVQDLMVVPLVHWNGPSDVFHLMSIFSPVDRNKLLVYSRLMPVYLRQFLLERGYTLVEVPDDEFDTMGCNVLALAPEKCLMIAGNPVTKSRLESAGCEVIAYAGIEISRKGCGGPTCLTRPLSRHPMA